MYRNFQHIFNLSKPVLDASLFNKESGISTCILCVVSILTDSPLAGL